MILVTTLAACVGLGLLYLRVPPGGLGYSGASVGVGAGSQEALRGGFGGTAGKHAPGRRQGPGGGPRLVVTTKENVHQACWVRMLKYSRVRR